MVERAQHRLAADLGGTIEIPVVEDMVLGHRLGDGVAIDRSGGGIDQPFHALAHTGFHDVERAADIDVEGAAREFVALEQPQGREMEDPVGAIQRGFEDVGLQYVAANIEDAHARILERALQIFRPAANEIVIDKDFANIFAEQAIGRVRADQPGTADQDIAQMASLLQNVADELLIDPPYRDQLGDGNWLIDAGGQVMKARPTADTDIILFDPRLAVDGLKYRFLKAKGLEYGEEQRDFIARLNKLAGRNAPVIDLNDDPGRVQ